MGEPRANKQVVHWQARRQMAAEHLMQQGAGTAAADGHGPSVAADGEEAAGRVSGEALGYSQIFW